MVPNMLRLVFFTVVSLMVAVAKTEGGCGPNTTMVCDRKGLILEQPEGCIQSPYYPKTYGRGISCRLKIKVPKRQKIRIKTLVFQLNNNKNDKGKCEDYVVIPLLQNDEMCGRKNINETLENKEIDFQFYSAPATTGINTQMDMYSFQIHYEAIGCIPLNKPEWAHNITSDEQGTYIKCSNGIIHTLQCQGYLWVGVSSGIQGRSWTGPNVSRLPCDEVESPKVNLKTTTTITTAAPTFITPRTTASLIRNGEYHKDNGALYLGVLLPLLLVVALVGAVIFLCWGRRNRNAKCYMFICVGKQGNAYSSGTSDRHLSIGTKGSLLHRPVKHPYNESPDATYTYIETDRPGKEYSDKYSYTYSGRASDLGDYGHYSLANDAKSNIPESQDGLSATSPGDVYAEVNGKPKATADDTLSAVGTGNVYAHVNKGKRLESITNDELGEGDTYADVVPCHTEMVENEIYAA